MNNDQFRKLVSSSATPISSNNGTSRPSSTSLGSRQKSSIPMTPRSVAGAPRNNSNLEFRRQLAEHYNNGNNPRPAKKARTSVPRGSKFADGYVDRAKARQAAESEDDENSKEARIKALEESLKREEIDDATFEKLRSQIAGGDIGSTHLVKGLDRELLQRVRAGEDVFTESTDGSAPQAANGGDNQLNAEEGVEADDALEALEGQAVTAITKDTPRIKKGQFATAAPATGQKRSRDQILAAMKAAREEALRANSTSAPEVNLGSKFKRIGVRQDAGSRIEIDAKGREVLIIVDEDGHEKRKVKKVPRQEQKEGYAPQVGGEILGADAVPEIYRKRQQEEEAAARLAAESEEIAMFSDAGSEYDPLKGLESDSEDEGSDEDVKKPAEIEGNGQEDGEILEAPPAAKSQAMPPPPNPTKPTSYFTSTLVSQEKHDKSGLIDPAVLAALRKAKSLNAAAKSEEEEAEAARQARLKAKLVNSARDDEDMDMGFGTDRMADDRENEDDGVKFSTWGEDDEEDGEGGRRGEKGGKKKRVGKKRKGDGNNMADVMQVLERRKVAKS